LESKQSLVNIGIPPILASIINEKFGKHSFIVGKWLMEYYRNPSAEDLPYKISSKLSDMVDLYNSALVGREAYMAQLAHLGVDMEDYNGIDYDTDPKREIRLIKNEIRDLFKQNCTFFYRNRIVEDIANGELTDLSPYKNLPYREAIQKYERKKLITDQKPIKVYEDGDKWIDVGKKCDLVADIMGNCGSVGLMGTDSERTMIALFNAEGSPHIVVTYSPNENKISGIEGKASSSAKEEYHDKILDLGKILGANPRIHGEKSPLLRIKFAFGDSFKNIEKLPARKSEWDQRNYYKITTTDNQIWYTDSNSLISEDQMEKIKEIIKNMTDKERVGLGNDEDLGVIFRNLPRLNIKFLSFYDIAKMFDSKVSDLNQ